MNGRRIARSHLPEPLAQTRLTAAMRTIWAAYRSNLRFAINRPKPLRSYLQDRPIGYLERVRVARGVMEVSGWTSAETLTLRSEVQSMSLSPDIERRDVPSDRKGLGFRATLPGVERLSVETGDGPLADISLRRLPHRTGAGLRTLVALIRVLILHNADLRAYALLGDSAAGNRLEDVLVPKPPSPAIRQAPVGLLDGPTPAAPSAPVTILVPVYDSFDDVAKCLGNLERHTDPRHRVIVIDDASPDPRILPEIEGFARRRANSEVVLQPENMGFVATVNRGLARATGHVVLLNSDAFVPEGWLDRLVGPLETRADIASVTPMTNNGEIATAPVICAPGDATREAVEAADAAARKLDPAKAVFDAPTAVGFCMAMSERWLKRVPSFDTAFGRGYGEEVDWCQKTAGLGAHHVISAALFVEHRGGRSFGEEKRRRMAESGRKITRRYPGYDSAVQEFIREDPGFGPRLAIGLAMVGAGCQVPVYLGHKLGGGAEHYLQSALERDLASGRAALVIRDSERPGRAHVFLHNERGVTDGDISDAELKHYLALVPRKEIVYSCLVSARDPLARLEHVVGNLSGDKRLRLLFHDFFPLCPSYNLLGHSGAFCGLPEASACQTCYSRLPQTSGKRPTLIRDWRSRWHAIAERADVIEVFSRSSFEIVGSVWPDLRGKMRIAPHDLSYLPTRVDKPEGRGAMIGVLGAIGYSKGAAVLRDLARAANGRAGITVIGELDPAYAHPGVTVHGRYRRDEISDLARTYGIDRWLIPSIWPETFSYATHECLATGLPVFAFDLGAQGEAVERAPNGHVLRSGDAAYVLDTILGEAGDSAVQLELA